MQHRQPDTRPWRLEDGLVHKRGAAPLGVGPFGRGRKEGVWGPEWASALLVLEWAFLCVLFHRHEQVEGPGWA